VRGRKSLNRIPALSILLTSCNGSSADVGLSTSQPLLGGELSTAADDAVVKVVATQATVTQTCTGALVANNLVLTARHCVADYVDLSFSCDSAGELVTTGPGGRTGATIAPEQITIKVGAQPADDTVDALGKQVFAEQTSTLCRNDIALVLLDRNLSVGSLLRIRLDRSSSHDERFRAVGYGLFEDPDAGVSLRHSKDGLVVTQVGASQLHPEGDDIPPRSFQVDGGGLCIGDSGGPAISERGAVIGVFSKFTGPCTASSTVSYYTETAPFADELILPAFAVAGAEPLPEYDIPSAGTAGNGAMSGATFAGASSAAAASGGTNNQADAAGATDIVGHEPLAYERTPPGGGTCSCRVAGTPRRPFEWLILPLLLLRARRRQTSTGLRHIHIGPPRYMALARSNRLMGTVRKVRRL
jgi:hypothetical protein